MMLFCPRCGRLVETVRHVYHLEYEDRVKIRCRDCGTLIEVHHYPIKREVPLKKLALFC